MVIMRSVDPHEEELNKWKELNKKIMECRKCIGLNVPKETMAATGHGSIHAELFVLGQSLHSYVEHYGDRQVPFVGEPSRLDSGNLLYGCLLLSGYGFIYNNIFVSNVVHCHPPKNRVSTKKEILNCIPYLTEEISLVNPEIILTTGEDARDVFNLTKEKTIVKREYIRVVKKSNKIFIVLVHPAYILRHGTEKTKYRYIKNFIDTFKEIDGIKADK